MIKCPISTKGLRVLGLGIWDLIRVIRNLSLVIIFILWVSPLFYSVYAVTNPISYTITVSATVGEPKLTLFGYSSPHAQVELRGNRVYEETTANEQSYFFFDRIFLPRPTPEYPELCLVSVDTHERTSFPICLPPLPVGPFDIQVGPVLLPPTISLEKGNFLPGEQVAARGSTVPNSEVTIFLASEGLSSEVARSDSSNGGMTKLPKVSIVFHLRGGRFVSPAYAYTLPQYQLHSDQNGHFEFNLPANWPATWRTFAAAKHLDSPTPKSNTLSFKVLSWWQWFWEKLRLLFLAFLGFIRPYLWLLIIVLEVVVIILLLKRKRRSRSHTKGGGIITP